MLTYKELKEYKLDYDAFIKKMSSKDDTDLIRNMVIDVLRFNHNGYDSNVTSNTKVKSVSFLLNWNTLIDLKIFVKK